LQVLLMPLWVRTIHDVPYGPSPNNRLDIMQPRWIGHPPRAAVIVFHGGAWLFGTRQDMRGRVCLPYLRQGFVVANVEYRLGAVLPAGEDAKRAVEWLFAHVGTYGIDRQRVVVTGESAGANLALLAAFQSGTRPAAVVNFYGVTDLNAMLDNAWVRRVLPADGMEDAARRASPVGYVRPGGPPVLSIHGLSDRVVPVEQTRELTEAVRSAGGDAAQFFIEGAGHGFFPPQQETAFTAVFQFLRQRWVLR
jgi:acetyl esterase/lipase